MDEVFNNKKFLVIEDSSFTIHILKALFEELKIKFDFYSKMEEVKKIDFSLYDAILLDIYLGKENTLRLLPIIRKANKNIIIVVISSSTEIVSSNEGISSQIDFIIPKPFEGFKLKEILKRVFLPENRRTKERVKGMAQSWVAKFNQKFNRPEVFESPNMTNISRTGMAFDSLYQYDIDDQLLVWVLMRSGGPQQQSKILEFKGAIIWKKNIDSKHSYGIHFDDLNEETSLYFDYMIS